MNYGRFHSQVVGSFCGKARIQDMLFEFSDLCRDIQTAVIKKKSDVMLPSNPH